MLNSNVLIDKFAEFSLYCAAGNGHFEIVNLLLEAFPILVKTPQVEGLLPLHLSVYGSDPCLNTLQLLLNIYPEAVLIKSNDGKTPLHVCVDGKSRPCIEAIQLLLKYGNDAASITTKIGKLPIHLVADHDSPCLVSLKLILEAYPDGAKQQDDFPNRRLPLHYTLMRPKSIPMIEAVEFLLGMYRHNKKTIVVLVVYILCI